MHIIKKHWPLIIVALLVGIFSILPLFFSLQRMGDDFQGIWPQFNGDANFYLSRSHEVFDGHSEMNNQYFLENKDATYPQANGGELFLAFLANIFNVSIPAMQAILTFVMPAIMAALFYVLLFLIYPNRLTSFIFPLFFFTIITGSMIKPIHPSLSFPLLLIFLISWMYLVLKKKHVTIAIIISGISLGALFLTYFFHWSFMLVVLGIFCLMLLITKNYSLIKHHILLVGIAVLIAIPFFIRIFSGIDSPLYEDMVLRMGVYKTHWPETFPRLTVSVAWAVLFAIVSRYYKLNKGMHAHVIFALLIANVIYPNHQVITGVTIENANHWSFMPIFIYAITAHYLIHTIIDYTRKKRSLLDWVFVLIITVMLIVPAWRLYTFTFSPYKKSLWRATSEESIQHYKSILNWIDVNTKPDSVIFSHLEFMKLVPVYTHANVYYTENIPYLMSTDKEVVERTLLYHYFDIDTFRSKNFRMLEVPRILWTQPAMIERNTHWLHNKLGIKYEQKYTLDKELEIVESIYGDISRDGWNISILNRYALDYIVWDRSINPDWDLESYSELENVYEEGLISIYIFKE